jgi:hypothetical protein
MEERFTTPKARYAFGAPRVYVTRISLARELGEPLARTITRSSGAEPVTSEDETFEPPGPALELPASTEKSVGESKRKARRRVIPVLRQFNED